MMNRRAFSRTLSTALPGSRAFIEHARIAKAHLEKQGVTFRS